MNLSASSIRPFWKPLVIVAGIVFLYAPVLAKLGFDWWTDDNYSHGLLVPFVIGFVIWLDLERLKRACDKPDVLFGLIAVAVSIMILLGGTLGAELFTQRISLVVIIAGTIVYFFGTKLLRSLLVPFGLLLLAIPIPQIIFNKVAFPLQLLASRIAEWGIRTIGIPATRRGNVIDLIPVNSMQSVGLEVVEACSGIRSLMTLVTLSLILGYFTRERRDSTIEGLRRVFRNPDVIRTALLMVSAVPIALITNAGRVIATGVLTYFYGPEIAEGVWHDISGSVVFLTALLLLILINFGLKNIFRRFMHLSPELDRKGDVPRIDPIATERRVVALFIVILIGGVFVNWLQHRGEVDLERKPLSEIPKQMGIWEQRGEDIRFDSETERVLRASDYVMRDYFSPGKRVNLYVGYYASRKSGATYHSPQNCLPGSGWEMKDGQLLQVSTPAGRKFTVNRYIVQRGNHREILIYWYQGRGRVTPSEYEDKIYTSLDSVLRRRSDGAMIRIMTPVGTDEARSLDAAIDLSSQFADTISTFLPE
jgi:exosortase D (VPLPA-CTERM-specific)